MIPTLQDWQWREFYNWAKIEYPDAVEEFERLPKTLMDFVEACHPHLIREFIDSGCGIMRQTTYFTYGVP
jgi:hypothetical protein